ncbi:hypothetical protein B0O99DRAFT_517719 [Bisporella sp. PMI_857]|nr:hypothetical protein B0O99DRAFT_517719 [Bisporella sp. PMI_857]
MERSTIQSQSPRRYPPSRWLRIRFADYLDSEYWDSYEATWIGKVDRDWIQG